MKRLTQVIAVVVAITPAVAFANNGNGNGNGHARHEGNAAHCPPGLAKQNPACVPPGQAAKYGIGDRIDASEFALVNPDRYHINRRGSFVRVGDYVYQVDRDTREVLNLIGAVEALLN